MGELFIKRSGLQAGEIGVCGQREERSKYIRTRPR